MSKSNLRELVDYLGRSIVKWLGGHLILDLPLMGLEGLFLSQQVKQENLVEWSAFPVEDRIIDMFVLMWVVQGSVSAVGKKSM